MPGFPIERRSGKHRHRGVGSYRRLTSNRGDVDNTGIAVRGDIEERFPIPP